jgi:hypothetical protein
MLVPSLAVAAIGAALFGVGLFLPFAEARLSRREPARDVQRPALPAEPSIDVVVAAYLESSVIGETIDRLHEQLKAVPGRTRVLVVASDPETARVARAHGAKVHDTLPLGKPAAVNLGVHVSNADVVVLTDANCEIVPDIWPQLMLAHLECADLVSAVKTESGKREEAYWAYEKAVKRFGRPRRETLSVIGEFLAFRREQFTDLPREVLADDLQMAEDFTVRGLSVQVVPGIETIEPPTPGPAQLERRIRISAGHWAQAIPRSRALAAFPAGRQFLAHKGYRMSIGALGFWLAVVGVGLALPPWSTLAVTVAVVLAFTCYRYWPNSPAPIRLFSTVFVLQAVTVLGAARALRRAVVSQPQYGWKKVAR